MITVREIYNFINELAPFGTQEKWDNSGLLVGSLWQEVKHVMVTLDISADAAAKAAELGCDLVVAHHPVIFSPLHHIPVENPVYQLIANCMAAICCHTPLDIARDGINDILVDMLSKVVAFEEEVHALDASGIGRIVTLCEPLPVSELAAIVKDVLGCTVVRYCDAGKEIGTLGICSGSGASMIEDIAGACDALLTGDVKHDRWYAAKNQGLSLIDCGHYHTEVVMVKALAEKLNERFPTIKVTAWEGGDPVAYV
ncbi:MAG: Nif3-like dinuclear metal center hexameric protein [Ruminococcus sp.]|nr:Nif3-like dinuclear metal center hexameric protein [Ruminococcus sp.]